MMTTFNLTINLTDEQYATVARECVGAYELFGQPDQWNIKETLAMLLRLEIKRCAALQRDRDNAAELQRRAAQQLPASIPAWIKELEESEESALMIRCGRCATVHDVTSRITGDTVLCQCGAPIHIVHRARVTKGGR